MKIVQTNLKTNKIIAIEENFSGSPEYIYQKNLKTGGYCLAPNTAKIGQVCIGGIIGTKKKTIQKTFSTIDAAKKFAEKFMNKRGLCAKGIRALEVYYPENRVTVIVA